MAHHRGELGRLVGVVRLDGGDLDGAKRRRAGLLLLFRWLLLQDLLPRGHMIIWGGYDLNFVVIFDAISSRTDSSIERPWVTSHRVVIVDFFILIQEMTAGADLFSCLELQSEECFQVAEAGHELVTDFLCKRLPLIEDI